MQKLSARERLLVGLTLFSMFFGAGNLIFPPFLGAEAAGAAIPALMGFIAAAVGLPILGVAAVAHAGGLNKLAGRVGPRFAFLFTLAIYLSIGPGLAIPRTASTSFEMVVRPFYSPEWSEMMKVTASAAYSALFFAAAWFVSLHPEKLTNWLGKRLMPTLLLLIGALFLGTLLTDSAASGAPSAAYAAAPFAKGFIEGYQTMDALAALNFGIVIAMNIRAFGVTDESAVSGETIKAGLIAAVFFVAVYGALAFIGVDAGARFPEAENGAQLLSRAAGALGGRAGNILIGAIFFIACFNTCVGLISCCGRYFSTTFPVLGYRAWTALFALVSMVVSNAGLTLILELSVPLLCALYPAAIVLIALGILETVFPKLAECRAVYRLAVAFAGIVSVAEAVRGWGLEWEAVDGLIAMLPLAAIGMAWMTPALAGGVLGGAFSLRRSAS